MLHLYKQNSSSLSCVNIFKCIFLSTLPANASLKSLDNFFIAMKSLRFKIDFGNGTTIELRAVIDDLMKFFHNLNQTLL